MKTLYCCTLVEEKVNKLPESFTSESFNKEQFICGCSNFTTKKKLWDYIKHGIIQDNIIYEPKLNLIKGKVIMKQDSAIETINHYKYLGIPVPDHVTFDIFIYKIENKIKNIIFDLMNYNPNLDVHHIYVHDDWPNITQYNAVKISYSEFINNKLNNKFIVPLLHRKSKINDNIVREMYVY
jgi:hypothetical protein